MLCFKFFGKNKNISLFFDKTNDIYLESGRTGISKRKIKQVDFAYFFCKNFLQMISKI
jgi:hypothetical protein